VAIDGTLTASDSRALRSRIDSLGKPLLGVLVTHAHPDHVAGIANLLGDSGASVVALESVRDLMRATEEAKRAQWGPVYGDEWIPRWVYPDRLVENGEAVAFDGVSFRVYEVGPGGDCDANSVWVLEDEPAAAFVGDLVFNGTHSYIADGRVLRWLANIERFRALLEGVATLYPGHGRAGGVELLDAQKDYLLAYCAAVLEVAGDSATTDERAKEELAERMRRVLPGAPLEFMIGLSADAVAAELSGKEANQ
jgi:glyoxylase-like metal-dependent hydrolase (beta-lactamase superfamily II)